MGIMSQIVSLEEDDDYVNLLVYGKSGVGKTVFAGSADRVLFIAPEDDGTMSAKRQGSKAKKIKVKSWDDFVSAYEGILEDIEEIQKSFDWIVVDSITHMQRLLMRGILEEAVEENESRDPDIPQMQDWQKYQNMFMRFVQQFNELPINILWTGLVMTGEDEEGEPFFLPDIQGKGGQMSQTVCSFMTSYGYLEAKKVVRKKNGEVVRDEDGKPVKRTVRTITWEDTGVIQGKDRTNVLAPRTVNKTLQDITNMIKGDA